MSSSKPNVKVLHLRAARPGEIIEAKWVREQLEIQPANPLAIWFVVSLELVGAVAQAHYVLPAAEAQVLMQKLTDSMFKEVLH